MEKQNEKKMEKQIIYESMNSGDLIKRGSPTNQEMRWSYPIKEFQSMEQKDYQSINLFAWERFAVYEWKIFKMCIFFSFSWLFDFYYN